MNTFANGTPGRFVRLVLCVLMTFAWTGGLFHCSNVLAQQQQQQRAGTANTGAEADPELDAVVKVLQRLVEMADEEQRKVKGDDPDPAVLAARLGGQPDALFAHVRDQVKTEPYAGVLRGAAGALSAAAAGPADKAVLL